MGEWSRYTCKYKRYLEIYMPCRLASYLPNCGAILNRYSVLRVQFPGMMDPGITVLDKHLIEARRHERKFEISWL